VSELGDLLELMHTSEERWRWLRAEGRESRHAGLNLEAFMRAVERRRSGSVGVLANSHRKVDEPEESERRWRLWMEGANRVRAEFALGHGDMVTAVVDGSTWWSWSRAMGAQTNEGREDSETGVGPGIALVRPAALLPAVDFEVRGRATKLGRSAYAVRAIPSPSNDVEELDLPHALGSGADEYELLVDAERGVLLRTEARLRGRPFLILEMDDVAFDEEISADMFRLVPPAGETFETLPISRSLLLEELPAAVAFTVVVPERAPDDAEVHATIERALPRYGVPEYADITYQTFPRETPPTFVAIRQSAGPVPESNETDWKDLGGFRIGRDRHTSPPTIRIRLETLGTHVELSSRNLSVDELLDMGRSLVPLPASPPT
jgi:outer membrane lipoprotein-sorting protein